MSGNLVADASAAIGDTSITVDDGSLMQVGDILEFGDASNVPSTDGAPSGFFYKITAINTHVLTIARFNPQTGATETGGLRHAVVDNAKILRHWEYYFNFSNAPTTSDDVSNAGGSLDEMHIVVIDEDGVITGTTGTITLGSTVSSGSITLIGDDGITLGGNLTSTATTDGAISFTGPVTLGANITIDADAANTDVNFTSAQTTINATSAGAQSLTIDTDAGNVSIQGAIGGSAKLSALSIDNADGAGTIEVFTIGTTSAVGVEGSTLIGNTNTATLTLDGADYRTTGLQTYTTAAGDKILVGVDDTATVSYTHLRAHET